jgi:hypothetical protein
MQDLGFECTVRYFESDWQKKLYSLDLSGNKINSNKNNDLKPQKPYFRTALFIPVIRCTHIILTKK